MSANYILLMVLAYFLMLLLVARLTGGRNDNRTFFTGNRSSPWYVVAFGMVGASLSGVTFISVPGWVEGQQFAYMQMVLGYLAGYAVIALVLMPMYYRLNLTSIYSYLNDRFGRSTYKTGASFFLLSRVIGASFRLFLVANVLQFAVFDALGIPFWATVTFTLILIWVYTNRGGIHTIVYTDTLQTTVMLAAVGLTVYYLSDALVPQGEGLIEYIAKHEYSRIFFVGQAEGEGGFWSNFLDGSTGQHFIKQFVGGMFITICMTGLDQDMMQKNLTCRSIGDAQKNMLWFSVILIFVNLLFLSLGVLLYDYADLNSISAANDDLYPAIALGGELPAVVAVLFVVGLIAAAYSSADSALTALTTSFSVDIMEVEKYNERKSKYIRRLTHIGMSSLILITIILFKYTAPRNVISEIFRVAGYTYGPLLGLYSFGLLTRWKVRDKWVPFAAILSPVLTYLLHTNSQAWFGYTFSFELLLVNGIIMFALLFMLRSRFDNLKTQQHPVLDQDA